MAFFGRIGNLLRQTASRQVSSKLRSPPSFFQAIRCMSSAPSTKLFIGGVSYSTDEQSLREAFSKYGEVVDARIIMDRETGRSRGFGFITYTSVEEASSAIQALDGQFSVGDDEVVMAHQDLHGRPIRVNYANERPRGYGGGGGGFGSYGAVGGGGYEGGGGSGYRGNVSDGYGGGNYSRNDGGGYGYGAGSYGSGGNYGDSGPGNNYSGGYSGSNSGHFGDAGSVGNHESSTGFAGNGYDGSVVDGGVGAGSEFGSSGQLDSKTSSNGDEGFGDYRDDNDADNFAKRA
ncbi:Glycine-rich RNA-binding protein 3, mitochondrial [Glycine max]|nr:hypothetical protein JHK85_047347 [Glycine max]KAH1201485.1 Glycine-rich RNA-binding protein 3, mitochondrial [Glycine max]KAH1201486.1 Glycine-rich RNA-binding protein 3, mitochondrial [Glycine max]